MDSVGCLVQTWSEASVSRRRISRESSREAASVIAGKYSSVNSTRSVNPTSMGLPKGIHANAEHGKPEDYIAEELGGDLGAVGGHVWASG